MTALDFCRRASGLHRRVRSARALSFFLFDLGDERLRGEVGLPIGG
jgi:hypothetical protein